MRIQDFKNMKETVFTGLLISFFLFFSSCKKDHKISVSGLDSKSGVLVTKVYLTSPFEIDSLNLRPEPYNPMAYTDMGAALSSLKEQGVMIYSASPNVEEYFDFNKYFPDTKSTPSFIYIFFNIYSEKEKEVALGLNYTQQIKVWLNSKELYTSEWLRNIKKQAESHVITKLVKGDNMVVVKLQKTDVDMHLAHWEYYCNIQNINTAKKQYLEDYWYDYIINPIIDDSVKKIDIYLGPYANSDNIVFSLYDEHNTKCFSINKNTTAINNAKWQFDCPEYLSDGIYTSELSLPDTVLNEVCFIGNIDSYSDSLIAKLKVNSDCEREKYVYPLSIRFQKLKNDVIGTKYNCDLFHTFKNKISTLLQLKNIDRIISGNLSYQNQPGTFLKEYVSPSDDSAQYYLFHVSGEVLDKAEKVPLIIYMPYHMTNLPIMPYSWYISDLYFINWELRLADQYGFAILFPYLRAQEKYNEIADTDLHEALNDLRKYYHIDDNNIYIMGDCAGGVKSLMACYRNPDLAAGIGCFNLEYTDDLYRGLNKLPTSLPIYISHSYKDKVPIEQADKFVKEAKQYNRNITYEKTEMESFNQPENKDEVIFRFFHELYTKQ